MAKHSLQDEVAQLQQLVPGIGTISFQAPRLSSVTTEWGVAWSEAMVARDLMQNFRDANKGDLGKIAVSASGRSVVVSAPVQFQLERLLYLGSEKSSEEGDIGQYGEGFKAASVALLRDFRVTPIVVSGSDVLRLSISPKPVAGTELFPIQYEFGRHDGACTGSHLVLLNCPASLSKEMKKGLDHFFWPEHPRLDELFSSSSKLDIYRAKGESGAGFYMGLKRCELPGIPVIFVFKKPIKRLDAKIGQDRDRKEFDEKVAATFYTAVATELDGDDVDLILLSSMKLWTRGRGHPLIARIASNLMRDEAYFVPQFPADFDMRGYYADIDDKWQLQRKPEMFAVHQEFLREKRQALPEYFAAFGFDHVYTVAKQRREQRLQAAKEMHQARPTKAEAAAIRFLVEAAGAFHPPLMQLLAFRNVVYLIGESEELLGEMRRARSYHSTEVMLNRRLFVGNFGDALGTLLHEAAHIFGFDGDRAFTDALTETLVKVLDSHEVVGDLHRRWEAVRAAVKAEREGRPVSLEDRLKSMPPDALLRMLSALPKKSVQAALDGEAQRSSEQPPQATSDGAFLRQ